MGKQSKLLQLQQNETRHAFLRTFFNQEKDHYEELPLHGFYLIKQWNAATKRWEVAIYTQESFLRRSSFFSTQPSDTATDVSS